MSGATPTERIDPTKHIHSHDMIDYSDLNEKEAAILKPLATMLSVSGSYSVDYIKESIMTSERICDHDDAYLCQCRLQHIIDYLKNELRK